MSDGNAAEESPALITYKAMFPRAECEAAIGELNAWTSVHNIAAAARCLAKAPDPDDLFDRRLVIPFPNEDGLERIIIQVFDWLIAAYRVPEPKISLAGLIEPRLTDERRALISAVRFQPSVAVGPSGSAMVLLSPESGVHPSDRYLLVEDEPHVIELLQGPLRAMMGLIRSTYQTASSAVDMRAQSASTGSMPTIFHKPYADSRLPAVIEALAFYACALDFGPHWARGMDMDISYRAVNVHGGPPFDAAFLEHARALTARMLDDLT